MCMSTIGNGLQLKFKQKIAAFISIGCSLYLYIYAFGFQPPFGSLPLFLLLTFVVFFFMFLPVALLASPNIRRWDDPEYQFRFFVSRMAATFFNACGTVDVFSDIALGLDLVRYFRGFVFGMGIALFVLCFLDFMMVAQRVLTPDQVSIQTQITTIVIEALVILLTISVIFGVQNDDVNDKETKHESIVIITISIATTLVNFLHHVFLLYDQVIANSWLHSGLSLMRG
eukprot:TRINITY_DN8206_c0_g1_i10.p3 TRINITY_DN8206_c0_g1~~TRINITY_DN8206_c0_g1_i10.p3  ORF type:complete len:228 (+),score=14.09 TRINITY_DN8206_c0_g1_i10:789-1472(+)